MDIAKATDLLWNARQNGEGPPAALEKCLSIEEGQAVQLAMLDRILAEGTRQIGWKLAGTAPAARAMLNIETPVFAYLLEGGAVASGSELRLPKEMCLFECELLVTLGEPLAGPGVDRDAVVGAVERVEASFELPQMRVPIREDPGLGVADGIAGWRWVVGAASTTPATDLDLGGIRVVAKKNGDTVFDVLSRDTVDDQFTSIADLANTLGSLGRSLEPGQSILTGSFGTPVPLEAGDHWEAELSSIGRVAVTLR